MIGRASGGMRDVTKDKMGLCGVLQLLYTSLLGI